MSRLTPEILDQVERAVQGTCHSLQNNFDSCSECYQYGFDFDDLTYAEEIQLNEYIEERHFECAQCGWWCESGDWAENQPDTTNGDICSNCGDE